MRRLLLMVLLAAGTAGAQPAVVLSRAACRLDGGAGCGPINALPVPVDKGGTGNTTSTPWSVVLTGTTATGAFKLDLGPGTSGQVLTSAGAGAYPTWASITAANTALSNLASVSINASLIPQTTLDLGAQSTPWKDLWLYGGGTYGSHSFRLTGTPTGHRVVTLPDSSTSVPIIPQVITVTGPTAPRTWTVPDAAFSLARIDAAQTFTGVETFATGRVLSAGATDTYTAPTADGTATGPRTCSFNSGYTSSAIGDLVYMDSSATWQKADADASATTYGGDLGIALEVKASGAALCVALPGAYVFATGFPTFTIGGVVYMSATAGAVTQTAPTGTDTAVRVVGYGFNADALHFVPSNSYVTLN